MGRKEEEKNAFSSGIMNNLLQNQCKSGHILVRILARPEHNLLLKILIIYTLEQHIETLSFLEAYFCLFLVFARSKHPQLLPLMINIASTKPKFIFLA